MSIELLKEIVGRAGWLDSSSDLTPFVTEWRGSWHGIPALVLLPATTAQVSKILKICNANGISVVPQGGNTGLCGGAIPDQSGKQVIVSLKRMNRIRSLSPENYSLVAEAGCILAELQTAADKVGRLFPLSLAAEGSCQIGGNLSTNAGGVNVLRYGTARQQVLGLEVVLPDGSVIEGLRELRKDTAGYDTKQLFIGAEGTLGIITAASLRLYPRVERTGTAMLAISSAPQAVSLLAELRGRLNDQLQAFELISAPAMAMVNRHIANTRNPLGSDSAWYVLLETALSGEAEILEQVLEVALDKSLISDAMIAKSETERQALWRIRHAVSEAQKFEGASLKHDVSVPVVAVGEFIEAATRAVEEFCEGARPVVFGHVGDGNVHFNVSQPAGWEADHFNALRQPMATAIHDVVAQFAGSFSAEHGIGVLKRAELRHYRSDTELALMTCVKSALDPHNIMNPGKVL